MAQLPTQEISLVTAAAAALNAATTETAMNVVVHFMVRTGVGNRVAETVEWSVEM